MEGHLLPNLLLGLPPLDLKPDAPRSKDKDTYESNDNKRLSTKRPASRSPHSHILQQFKGDTQFEDAATPVPGSTHTCFSDEDMRTVDSHPRSVPAPPVRQVERQFIVSPGSSPTTSHNEREQEDSPALQKRDGDPVSKLNERYAKGDVICSGGKRNIPAPLPGKDVQFIAWEQPGKLSGQAFWTCVFVCPVRRQCFVGGKLLNCDPTDHFTDPQGLQWYRQKKHAKKAAAGKAEDFFSYLAGEPISCERIRFCQEEPRELVYDDNLSTSTELGLPQSIPRQAAVQILDLLGIN